MDVKKIVLLVVALVVAAGTALMAKNMFSGAGAPQAEAKAAPVAGPEVLVATRALPVGTIIDAEALRYQPWPKGLVQDAYFIKGEPGVSPQDLIGTVVRNETSAGQPLAQGTLIKPGDRGFLAAALGPGMRAVTVPVNITSSVAGFIFPGDRVDVMLTQQVSGTGDGPPLKASETILRNLRVLATNQRMNAIDAQGKPVLTKISTVTLEVTPQIAEKIVVAQTLGKLSLALRSIADSSAELEQAIASGNVNVPEGTTPAAERRMLSAMASRPSDDNPTVTVGGDVSRYQRRTVPVAPPKPPIEGGYTGPVVAIARGNNVQVIPVGAK